ncbi:MAG: 6-phosphogluconolactonase [Solirubrobacteraceae bacterium]
MTRITTLADPEAVAVRAARDIAGQLQRAIEQRGRAHLALSGGGTPERTYELLVDAVEDWDAVEVWFADERCVPPQDEQSNYRMAAQTLLDRLASPPRAVHRMQGELGPQEGAHLYAQELRASFDGHESDVPALDLIVLGIGPDGHVASLFPGAPTLAAEDHELCLAVHDSPKPPSERITLSLAVLRAANRCLLLATGPSKADAVSAAMGEPTKHVPASLLRRERLTMILDDMAAPAR